MTSFIFNYIKSNQIDFNKIIIIMKISIFYIWFEGKIA